MPSIDRGATMLLALLMAGAGTVPAAGASAAGDDGGSEDVLTVLVDGSVSSLQPLAFRGEEVSVTTGAVGSPDGITVRGGTPDEQLTFHLSSGYDDPRLTVGRSPVGDGRRYLVVLGSRDCSTSTGHVDVLDLGRGVDGRLTSLALDYRVTCSPSGGALAGSVRWRSSVSFAHTTTTPVSPPATGAGLTARGTAVLTNDGTQPQSYGSSTWRPAPDGAPARLVVDSDGCTGKTLQPGSSCSVGVSMLSDGVVDARGALVTTDGTAWGATLTPVVIDAVPAPRTPVISAVPVRGGVRLSGSGSASDAYRVLRTVVGGGEAGRERVVADGVRLPWTDVDTVAGTRYAYRVVARAGGLEAAPSGSATSGPLPVPAGAEGTFVPVDPVRVLDTRSGLGAPRGRLGQQQTLTFDPTIDEVVPASGVSAVLLNVTGTQSTQPTHVRVWPTGTPLPSTSSLNLQGGQDRANQVVVPLGSDGRVALYNNTGSTHLVVDVQGYYSTSAGEDGSGFHPLSPRRVLDTREDDVPLSPGGEELVAVGAHPGVDWDTVTAVDVNLTVTEPTTAGHLTAWPGDLAAPDVSNVNFATGQTVANHAVVPVVVDELTGEPFIAVRNSNGRTHLVVDVLGWYDDGSDPSGLRFTASPTARVTDTRLSGTRVPAGGAAVVPPTSMPPAEAHVVNVTATASTGPGHLTAWSGDGQRPSTSTVNYARAEDSPNLAAVRAGADGRIAVGASSSPSHVVVDHLGYFW